MCGIEIQKYSSCIANFKFNIYLGFDFSIILCFLENIKKMRTLLPRTTTLVLQSLNSFKKFQSSRDWQYFAQFCTNYLCPLWHFDNSLLFHCTVMGDENKCSEKQSVMHWYQDFFIFLVVSQPVSLQIGTGKKSRNRYRKNLAPGKSLGTVIGKIWYRN